MATTLDAHRGLPGRISAAAERCRDITKELDNERARRDELIVTAYDEGGMTLASIAEAAGVSKPQVIRILSKSSDD